MHGAQTIHERWLSWVDFFFPSDHMASKQHFHYSLASLLPCLESMVHHHDQPLPYNSIPLSQSLATPNSWLELALHLPCSCPQLQNEFRLKIYNYIFICNHNSQVCPQDSLAMLWSIYDPHSGISILYLLPTLLKFLIPILLSVDDLII